MKRILLGSLLSCMLVSQVFASDDVTESTSTKAWNGFSALVKGIALGAGTTAAGTAVGSLASHGCVAAGGVVAADLLQTLMLKYPGMNECGRRDVGFLDWFATQRELTKGSKEFKAGLSDNFVARAAQSNDLQNGLLGAGTFAGVGYNLYKGLSTLSECLEVKSTLTLSNGMHAIGRMIGSVAAACLAVKYRGALVAGMQVQI